MTAEAEEEIRYKAISVKDLLIKINNIVELMIDLAYAAVLFNDVELAEEVLEFDRQVDYLTTLLHMNISLSVRNRKDAEAMTGIIHIATASERISGAAREIARTVLSGLSVGEDVIGALSRTEERLVRTEIAPESILSGRTRGKLALKTKIGVDLIAIRRGKDLTINPAGNYKLAAGDVMIARGSDVGISELDKLAKGELKTIPEPVVK